MSLLRQPSFCFFLEKLDHAQKEILVQAFSFFSAPIRNLCLKLVRVIRVEVMLDKGQVTHKYSSAPFLHAFRNIKINNIK
jgi:hypothetical protein